MRAKSVNLGENHWLITFDQIDYVIRLVANQTWRVVCKQYKTRSGIVKEKHGLGKEEIIHYLETTYAPLENNPN